MRRGALLIVVTLSGAPLAAQEPWVASYYPFLVKGPNDNLSLVARWHSARNADYEDRVPFIGIVSVEAGVNASGSRFLVGQLKWPRMADGWRLHASAGAERENRFGYFGLGNGAEREEDLPAGSRWYNRMRRSRVFGRLDVTRVVAGPVLVSLGTGFTDAAFRSLPGDSRFFDDRFVTIPCLPGEGCPPPPGDPSDTDATIHLRAIADTRDNEFVPTRGVLLEAGGWLGSGGEGYAGAYGIASGYVPPWFGAVIAVRVMGRWLDVEAPLDARYTLSAWERSIPVLGGPESHRSYLYGRWAGRNLLLANVEFRQDILNFADYGAITAVGFFDAGRATEGLPDEPDDFRVGGGAALALRILRSTVLQFNFARGGDGFQFSMGTGWMF